jgi:hypothetical protein
VEGCQVGEDVFPAAVVVDGAGWVESSVQRSVSIANMYEESTLGDRTSSGSRDYECGFCGQGCG